MVLGRAHRSSRPSAGRTRHTRSRLRGLASSCAVDGLGDTLGRRLRGRARTTRRRHRDRRPGGSRAPPTNRVTTDHSASRLEPRGAGIIVDRDRPHRRPSTPIAGGSNRRRSHVRQSDGGVPPLPRSPVGQTTQADPDCRKQHVPSRAQLRSTGWRERPDCRSPPYVAPTCGGGIETLGRLGTPRRSRSAATTRAAATRSGSWPMVRAIQSM